MSEKKPLTPKTPDPASRIETDRLLLKVPQQSDLDNLAALFADAEVMRYVGNGQPVDRTEAEKALVSIIARWNRHGFGRWIVEEKASGEFVGYGGLRSLFGTPEVVYHLAKRHWGKGFASEMARAFLQFGFNERRFTRIVAIAKPGNAASIHVMEKLGMRFEMQTNYYGMVVVQYAITAEELKSKR